MAGCWAVRRVLLVNALIFAILAAAVALAYYGYSYTTESRDRELRLLQDLADEKVSDIEARVAKDDEALFEQARLDDLSKLQELAASMPVKSVFVLDDKLRIVPDGYMSSREDG